MIRANRFARIALRIALVTKAPPTPLLHLKNPRILTKSAATRVARQGVPAHVCNYVRSEHPGRTVWRDADNAVQVSLSVEVHYLLIGGGLNAIVMQQFKYRAAIEQDFASKTLDNIGKHLGTQRLVGIVALPSVNDFLASLPPTPFTIPHLHRKIKQEGPQKRGVLWVSSSFCDLGKFSRNFPAIFPGDLVKSEKHRAREPRNLTYELSHESAHENAHGSVHEDAQRNAHES